MLRPFPFRRSIPFFFLILHFYSNMANGIFVHDASAKHLNESSGFLMVAPKGGDGFAAGWICIWLEKLLCGGF